MTFTKVINTSAQISHRARTEHFCAKCAIAAIEPPPLSMAGPTCPTWITMFNYPRPHRPGLFPGPPPGPA